jgi:hypothetical protein
VHTSPGRMMRTTVCGLGSSGSCDGYVMSSFGQRVVHFGRWPLHAAGGSMAGISLPKCSKRK